MPQTEQSSYTRYVGTAWSLSSIAEAMVVGVIYATTGANEGAANARATAVFTRLTRFALVRCCLGFARKKATSACIQG